MFSIATTLNLSIMLKNSTHVFIELNWLLLQVSDKIKESTDKFHVENSLILDIKTYFDFQN